MGRDVTRDPRPQMWDGTAALSAHCDSTILLQARNRPNSAMVGSRHRALFSCRLSDPAANLAGNNSPQQIATKGIQVTSADEQRAAEILK